MSATDLPRASGRRVGLPDSSTPPTGLRRFGANLRSLPQTLRGAVSRTGPPTTDRARSSFVFSNIFLHLHSVRVHLWTFRWSSTWGLGIAALSAFLVTLVTGILLMFYYKPYPDAAYWSVKDIHFVVPTGKFIRNIHRWAAQVMVFVVFAHMARVFYTASYRSPREFNWMAGMGLLVLTLGLSFTGYLLPWDQLAYWAITIGANIAQSPREVTDAIGVTATFDPGGMVRFLLLGSEEIGEEALIRFYLLHVMVLPLLLGALLGVHFWRIRKDGGLARPADADRRVADTTVPVQPVFTDAPRKTYHLAALVRGTSPAVGRAPEKTVPAMPHLFYAELAVLMLTIFVCVALSLVSDAPLKEHANPAVPENPAKAPWYFLGLQELVAYSAFMGGMGLPTLVIIGLTLIPLLDRETEGTGEWFGGPGGLPLVLRSAVFGFATVIAIEAVAIRFGWLREWFPDIPQLVVTFVNPGTLIAAAYAGYSILCVKRYDSTRAGALALFTCFLCGFVVLTIVGVHFRGPNWHFFWSPADWPAH